MAREKVTKQEQKYSKSEFLRAAQYSGCRDMLMILLEDNEEYSTDEVDNRIKEFKEREVQ